MNREIRMVFADQDVLDEFFDAAVAVSPIGARNGVAYNVNVCRLLKKLTDEDFTNEMPRTDSFTSVAKEGMSVTLVTSNESVHLPTLHKFVDYMCDYYQFYNVKSSFNGKLYKTDTCSLDEED